MAAGHEKTTDVANYANRILKRGKKKQTATVVACRERRDTCSEGAKTGLIALTRGSYHCAAMARLASACRQYLDSALSVAVVSISLGLADFLIFDFARSAGGIDVFSLLKPSFFSMSPLLTQLCACLGVGLLLHLPLWFAELTVERFAPAPRIALAAPLAIVGLSTIVVGLRFWITSGESSRLALLLPSAVALVLLSVGLGRSKYELGRGINIGWTSRMSAFIALVSMILGAAFLLPEIPFNLQFNGSDLESKSAGRPNVVLLVLDTVRADRLSCYGSETTKTRAIDRVASEGLRFQNAYSTAPWTVPSHASMFTGLWTAEHSADWGSVVLGESFETLAEHLSRQGYVTVGFCENPFIGRSTGMDQGFSAFIDTWRRPLLPRAMRRVAGSLGFSRDRKEFAERTVGLFKLWLRRAPEDSPFFAYINLMAAHLPRYPRGRDYPQAILQKIQFVNRVPERNYLCEYQLNQDELSAMRSIYDEEIEYLDLHVEELMAILDEEGLLDDTVVIITSDHGEMFGEHGYIEHQLCLYNELIRVPLIIRYPKELEPRVATQNVSTVALPATVASLVGSSASWSEGSRRRSPLHLVSRNQMVVAEYSNGVQMLREAIEHEAPGFDFSPFDRSLSCVIDGEFKFIVDSNGGSELFNLRNDPLEQTDLSHEMPEIVHRLLRAYTSPIVTGVAEVGPNSGEIVDRDTLDALRELGYVH
jgi:arylsulfatase A-like enzyme